MRHEPRQVSSVSHGLRFHQMPAGEIGAADVANLASSHEIIERLHRFINGRERIEGMELKQINVIDADAFETGLDGSGDVLPR